VRRVLHRFASLREEGTRTWRGVEILYSAEEGSSEERGEDEVELVGGGVESVEEKT